MYRSPKETYQESKFFTANPAELVLICYDGAIGNLRAIYTYLVRSLIEADLKADLDAFDRAIKILAELASSWKEITKPKEEVKHEPAGMNPEMRQVQVGKPGRNTASAVA